jgi:hypothetical protein
LHVLLLIVKQLLQLLIDIDYLRDLLWISSYHDDCACTILSIYLLLIQKLNRTDPTTAACLLGCLTLKDVLDAIELFEGVVLRVQHVEHKKGAAEHELDVVGLELLQLLRHRFKLVVLPTNF